MWPKTIILQTPNRSLPSIRGVCCFSSFGLMYEICPHCIKALATSSGITGETAGVSGTGFIPYGGGSGGKERRKEYGMRCEFRKGVEAIFVFG